MCDEKWQWKYTDNATKRSNLVKSEPNIRWTNYNYRGSNPKTKAAKDREDDFSNGFQFLWLPGLEQWKVILELCSLFL